MSQGLLCGFMVLLKTLTSFTSHQERPPHWTWKHGDVWSHSNLAVHPFAPTHPQTLHSEGSSPPVEEERKQKLCSQSRAEAARSQQRPRASSFPRPGMECPCTIHSLSVLTVSPTWGRSGEGSHLPSTENSIGTH